MKYSFLCIVGGFCAALACYLLFQPECSRAKIENPNIYCCVGVPKNVLIYDRTVKPHRSFSSHDLSKYRRSQTFSKSLQSNFLFLSSSHYYWRKIIDSTAQIYSFDNQLNSEFRILGSRAPEVLIQDFDMGVLAERSLRRHSNGIQENIGSLGSFYCIAAEYCGFSRFLSGVLRLRGLLFQIVQGSEGGPDRESSDNYQSPIRPEEISPWWKWPLVRRLCGLPLILFGGYLRWERKHTALSLITFMLGWCLLWGPSLPKISGQQNSNWENVSESHGR